MAAAMLWAAAPGWGTALLLALIAWSSARFSYCRFCVLERYVDPTLECAGVDGADR